MIIIMDRRVLQGISCKVHEIKQGFGQQIGHTADNSDSELNDFL